MIQDRLPGAGHPPLLRHAVATIGGRRRRHRGTATVTEMHAWLAAIETGIGTGRDTTPLPTVARCHRRNHVPHLRVADTRARGVARHRVRRPGETVTTTEDGTTRGIGGTGTIPEIADGLILETGIGGTRGGSAEARMDDAQNDYNLHL